MDLAIAANAPEPISIGGQTFHVRLLTMRERGQIQAFLKRELLDPVTRASIAIQRAKNSGTPLDASVVSQLYDRAETAALSWPPRFGSESWFDAINGVDDGDTRLLHEILSKIDPTFALDKAEALSPRVTIDELSDLVRVAFWGAPPRPKDQESPTIVPPTP